MVAPSALGDSALVIAKAVPSVPNALAALANMEAEFSSAKTYEAFQKIERKVDALKTLFRDVAEVKNKCERVVLAASQRIGEEIQRHPKATAPYRHPSIAIARAVLPPDGRGAIGVERHARSRLQRLAAIPRPDLDAIATRIQDAGKDATVNAVLRVVKEGEIQAKRAAYEARTERGGTVADLAQLAASGRRFAVIYSDPPWPFETYSPNGQHTSVEHHYGTMTIDEIKRVPVEALAAKDCALFLWTTWPRLEGALEVISAWGFAYKTAAFTWVKQNKSGDGLFTGNGYWTRSNSEICLLATRGAPTRIAKDVHQIIMAPVGAHSAKPDEARRRIERLVLGPYLELFARQKTDGWFAWGNEIPAEEDPAMARRRRGRPPKIKTPLEAAE